MTSFPLITTPVFKQTLDPGPFPLHFTIQNQATPTSTKVVTITRAEAVLTHLFFMTNLSGKSLFPPFYRWGSGSRERWDRWSHSWRCQSRDWASGVPLSVTGATPAESNQTTCTGPPDTDLHVRHPEASWVLPTCQRQPVASFFLLIAHMCNVLR